MALTASLVVNVSSALSASQPCLPSCLVSPPALSAHLLCQLTCLVSLPALSFHLPCQPICLDSPPALSACLPCQPACLVSPPALFMPSTSTFVEMIFCELAHRHKTVHRLFIGMAHLPWFHSVDMLPATA
jgi:hypothetical protein